MNNDEISKRIKSVKKINKSSINASKIGVYLAWDRHWRSIWVVALANDCWAKQKPDPRQREISRRFCVLHIDLIEIKKSLKWIRYAQCARAECCALLLPPSPPSVCSNQQRKQKAQQQQHQRQQFQRFFTGSMTNNTRIDICSGQMWTVIESKVHANQNEPPVRSDSIQIETTNLINMYRFWISYRCPLLDVSRMC